MTVGTLAQNVDMKVGRAVQLFLHSGTGKFPGKIEFILTKRSRKHYLASQTGLAPLGGMEDKTEAKASDAEILKRELQEEVLGLSEATHPGKFKDGRIDPDKLTRREWTIYDIFDRRVNPLNMELMHREPDEPKVEDWNLTDNGFYILKELDGWEYRAIKGFLARRNKLGNLENYTSTGESSGFYAATVSQLIEHTKHAVSGERSLLSMNPEEHAFNRGLFYFLHKFTEGSNKAMLKLRVAKALFLRNLRDRSSLYPYELNYKPGEEAERKIINSDGQEVIIKCPVLDDKHQPAFESHSVKAHSRGIRFIEIAKANGTITTKEGKTLDVIEGQVIATVMEFDEYGKLRVATGRTGLPDVYLPDDDGETNPDGSKKPLMAGRLRLSGYKQMDRKNPVYKGETYLNSNLNGVYIRQDGRDYDVLPEPIKVPTVLGDKDKGPIAMPGDMLIRRTDDAGNQTLEIMEEKFFKGDVVAMPRYFDSQCHWAQIRRNRGRQPPPLRKLAA